VNLHAAFVLPHPYKSMTAPSVERPFLSSAFFPGKTSRPPDYSLKPRAYCWGCSVVREQNVRICLGKELTSRNEAATIINGLQNWGPFMSGLRQKQKDRRRRDILDAAARLLEAQGYE
jgi:hypothetical protein